MSPRREAPPRAGGDTAAPGPELAPVASVSPGLGELARLFFPLSRRECARCYSVLPAVTMFCPLPQCSFCPQRLLGCPELLAVLGDSDCRAGHQRSELVVFFSEIWNYG